MKILGKSSDGYSEKYILEVTDSELAKITGYSHPSDSDFRRDVDKVIKYKQDINVSRIYDTHQAIKYIKSRGEIGKVREKLKEMLSALEPMTELIEEIPTVIKE